MIETQVMVQVGTTKEMRVEMDEDSIGKLGGVKNVTTCCSIVEPRCYLLCVSFKKV